MEQRTEKRTCTACGESKSVDEFYRRKVCRPCENARRRARRKAKPSHLKPRLCPRCGVTKAPAEYTGTHGYCRECCAAYARERKRAIGLEEINRLQREYRVENLEHMRDYDRLQHQKHSEKRNARQRERYAKNAEAYRAARKAYYELNKEACLAAGREWARAHPEKLAEYGKRHKAKNPDLMRVINNNRRTRIGGKRVSAKELQSLWTGDCGICGGPINRTLRWPDVMSRSVDHIIPLARGGEHVLTNLQWVHLVCNCRKGSSLPSA